MPIRSYLGEQSTFEPLHVEAMSAALTDACCTLGIPHTDAKGRETIAARIIDLARNGVFDAKALSARGVKEAQS